MLNIEKSRQAKYFAIALPIYKSNIPFDPTLLSEIGKLSIQFLDSIIIQLD